MTRRVISSQRQLSLGLIFFNGSCQECFCDGEMHWFLFVYVALYVNAFYPP